MGATDDNDTKSNKRKKRVVIGYRAASIACLFSGCVAFKTYVGSGAALASGFLLSSGPLLASGVAYILSGAASNDRLQSDTYKRLNLFLGVYAVCALIVAAILPTMRKPFYVGGSMLALINSIKGFGYGVKGWELSVLRGGVGPVLQGLVEAMKGMVKVSFTLPNNVKSFGYMAATLMVGSLAVAKKVDIISWLVRAARTGGSSPDTLLPLGTWVARYGRLALLAAIMLTLKDAADRDRLEGTTFIALNFMSSYALGSMAAYYVQGGSMALGGAAALVSAFSALNGVTSMIKKRNKET